jgi:hypothetical protein
MECSFHYIEPLAIASMHFIQKNKLHQRKTVLSALCLFPVIARKDVKNFFLWPTRHFSCPPIPRLRTGGKGKRVCPYAVRQRGLCFRGGQNAHWIRSRMQPSFCIDTNRTWGNSGKRSLFIASCLGQEKSFMTKNFREGRAIAQAVSRWLPTAEARVQTRVYSCGIYGGQSGAEAGFLRVLGFPLSIFIPPISPQSPSPIIQGWYNRPVVAAVPRDSVSPH